MQLTSPIIGHRGACAYAPENTLISFNQALMLGCQFLEFDVMLSADGEPFVFHDESLKRTTNGQGQFGLVNSSYIQTLDAGKWFNRRFIGEKVPHLRDVLEWLIFTNIQANIEIKPYPGKANETTLAVLTHINRFWPAAKPLPLISSFNLRALNLCKTIMPDIYLGLLLDRWDDKWLEKAKKYDCYSIHFNKLALTESRVKAIKLEGYALYAYTVNRKRQAKKLLAWGVDALFSDYPDLLV